jgi:hypothetical protein
MTVQLSIFDYVRVVIEDDRNLAGGRRRECAEIATVYAKSTILIILAYL